jgi:hypothetical protein
MHRLYLALALLLALIVVALLFGPAVWVALNDRSSLEPCWQETIPPCAEQEGP